MEMGLDGSYASRDSQQQQQQQQQQQHHRHHSGKEQIIVQHKENLEMLTRCLTLLDGFVHDSVACCMQRVTKD